MNATFEEQLRRLRFGKQQTKFLDFLTSPPPDLRPHRDAIRDVKLDTKQWADISSALQKTALQIRSDMYEIAMSQDEKSNQAFQQRCSRAKNDAKLSVLSPAMLEFTHVAIGMRLKWLMESAEYLQQYQYERQIHIEARKRGVPQPQWKAANTLPFPCAAKRFSYAVNQLWPLWIAYITFLDQVTDTRTTIDTIPVFAQEDSSRRMKMYNTAKTFIKGTTAPLKDSRNIRRMSDVSTQAPPLAARPFVASRISTSSSLMESQVLRNATTIQDSSSLSSIDMRIMSDPIARKIKHELKWGSALCNWIVWISDHADSALTLISWHRGHQNMRFMPPIDVYHSRMGEVIPGPVACDPPSQKSILQDLISEIKASDPTTWTTEIKHCLEWASQRRSLQPLLDKLRGQCDAPVPLEVELLLKFARDSFCTRPGFILNAHPFLASPDTIPFTSALMLDALVEKIWGGPVVRKDAVRARLPESLGNDLKRVQTSAVGHVEDQPSPMSKIESESIGTLAHSEGGSLNAKRRRRNDDVPPSKLMTMPGRSRPVGCMADVSVRPEFNPMTLPPMASAETCAALEEAKLVALDQLRTEMVERLKGGKDEWEAFMKELVRLESL